MGKLTLYGIDGSPPVRSVFLTLNALGLEFHYKIVNLLEKEHLTPEFLKINPLHTVPVLEDDVFQHGHRVLRVLQGELLAPIFPGQQVHQLVFVLKAQRVQGQFTGPHRRTCLYTV